MSTHDKNNKSDKKGIRFPHQLLNDIQARVEEEKAENDKASFSGWVIDACEQKLKQKNLKK